MTEINLNDINQNRRRQIFRLVTLVLILISIGYMLTLPLDRVLSAVDFTAYWSASRLNLDGKNPYSIDGLYEFQIKELNWTHEAPVITHNPPWVLGIILPLGLLPYTAGRMLWLLLSITIVLVCSDISWQLYKGPPKMRWIA